MSCSLSFGVFFLSDIFKKQFPNPRKTDLSLCCVVKPAALTPVRQFYTKRNQTKKSRCAGNSGGGEIRTNILMDIQ